MTAIVGILNKSGIAIAADSAATVSNNRSRKVLNTETKIFRLSKTYPVAVMIYDSTLFMETPWEVIIKLYCRRRGDKGKNTLKEYVDDFLQFLREENFFCSKEVQDRKLSNMLIDFYQLARDKAKEEFEEQEEENPTSYNDLFLDRLKEYKRICSEEFEKCPELKNYPFRTFQNKAQSTIDMIIEQGFTNEHFDVTQRELFESSAYEWIKSICFLGNQNSGLVFAGYGEKDIFPCMLPIEVAGVVNGRLRHFVNHERIAQIDHNNIATICPYAQADVMQTFMDGISPDIREHILERDTQLVNQVQNRIYEKLAAANVGEEILELVRNIDFNETREQMDEELSEYIQKEKEDGLLTAVEMFNVQELASMAESLVSITNLQRHFTSSEETVGGPVDVAVITRNEGFIWIKRKLWFSQEMNRHIMRDE